MRSSTCRVGFIRPDALETAVLAGITRLAASTIEFGALGQAGANGCESLRSGRSLPAVLRQGEIENFRDMQSRPGGSIQDLMAARKADRDD